MDKHRRKTWSFCLKYSILYKSSEILRDGWYLLGILVKTATLQNGHTQNGHKTFCYQNGHNQNGHTAFGQNGHRGRITTKTATLHLVKTATEGGSLPKRPHCIFDNAFGQKPRRDVHYQNGHTIAKWPETFNMIPERQGGSLPKRPHYSKLATETETLNMIPERGRITTKIMDIHDWIMGINYGYP